MHSDAHCREVIDQNRLKAFFPHPFLEKHFSDLASENRRKRVLASEAGTHNLPHFHLMKETILAAVTGLNDSLKPCHTLVLGAKECNDLPLETLAGMGPVYLIDVDMKSMETARQRLAPPSLRDTVHLVSMDVSLFVSSLLEKAHDLLQQYADDIAGAWQAIVDMHNEITQRDQPLFEKKGLPIRNRQADLALSTMTLSQFVTGYLNLLVNHFLMIYGRQQVKDHFLEGQKVDELVDSSLPLALGAAEAHIRELGRIVHTEGLIVFADHALHGQGVFISEQYMDLDVESLVSYSKNKNENKFLHFRNPSEEGPPARIQMDITAFDPTFMVQGEHAFKNILRKMPQVEILNQKNWWWATERVSRSDPAQPVWNVSYVEAFTLRSK